MEKKKRKKRLTKESLLKVARKFNEKSRGVSSRYADAKLNAAGGWFGNIRGMGRGKERGIDAFIGLVPMLAIYVEHLRRPDVRPMSRVATDRTMRES